MRSIKVYALIGKSGTGKSFRSKFLTDKHHIDLIVDDGLLIKDDKIIAGKSSKKEPNFLAAVRCAVFDDPKHQEEVVDALARTKYKKILLIGTSEKMVSKIATKLGIPQPEKIYNIEDISTPEEIETALRIRYVEGKHVIPVPAIEVTRNYPKIAYDSVKILFKKKHSLKGSKVHEKTIVKPVFSQTIKGKVTDAALLQMVNHCMGEYDSSIKVVSVHSTVNDRGYNLSIKLKVPLSYSINISISKLQEYIIEALEKYGSLFITSVNLEIEEQA